MYFDKRKVLRISIRLLWLHSKVIYIIFGGILVGNKLPVSLGEEVCDRNTVFNQCNWNGDY